LDPFRTQIIFIHLTCLRVYEIVGGFPFPNRFLSAVQQYLSKPDLRQRLDFKVVAFRMMKDALWSYRRSMTRLKRTALVMSIDAPVTEDGATIASIIPDSEADTTVATTNLTINIIDQFLTGPQQRLLRLRMLGYSAKEMSPLVRLSEGTIYRNFSNMREQIPACCVM
jgi:DNA-directed RNA polymerase specialized sigma24 family protein